MDERTTQLLTETREALAASAKLSDSRAFVGFDGFIDDVVRVVDKRESADSYSPIPTIAEYARRLAQAAGKSTNVEMVTLQTKMGGNGPLMADALGRLGCRLRYVGAVGDGVIDPVFATLEDHGEVLPIAAAAHTIAAEFEDGKIMHGRMDSLLALTPEFLLKRVGGLQGLAERLRGCRLLGLINWTMTPHATGLWRTTAEALGLLSADEQPDFAFFDLCDPQKRPTEQLVEALDVLASFQELSGVQPILGLNEKESEEVCSALGMSAGPNNGEGLIHRAEAIAQRLRGIEIVIHPTARAAAWTPNDAGWTDGPLCANPVLTTGAGDHFNGGYCAGRLLGLPPHLAVVTGKCVSGFYVRNGRGPHASDLDAFLGRWIDGTLDPWKRPA